MPCLNMQCIQIYSILQFCSFMAVKHKLVSTWDISKTIFNTLEKVCLATPHYRGCFVKFIIVVFSVAPWVVADTDTNATPHNAAKVVFESDGKWPEMKSSILKHIHNKYVNTWDISKTVFNTSEKVCLVSPYCRGCFAKFIIVIAVFSIAPWVVTDTGTTPRKVVKFIFELDRKWLKMKPGILKDIHKYLTNSAAFVSYYSRMHTEINLEGQDTLYVIYAGRKNIRPSLSKRKHGQGFNISLLEIESCATHTLYVGHPFD